MAGHRAGDKRRQAQSDLGNTTGIVSIMMFVGRRVQLGVSVHGGEAKVPRKTSLDDVFGRCMTSSCQILGPPQRLVDRSESIK